MKHALANNSLRLRRGGFTLVEMLVATALVVLIMLMFAQVFGMATQAMSQQKGMAELDQGARTITTVLTNDLHYRTFRDVVPFKAGDITTAGGPNFEPDRRRGYFYISENNPFDDTDDVFQLTIDVRNTLVRGTPFARGDSNARREPSARDPYLTGRSELLPFTGADPRTNTPPDLPNQPEFDDGDPDDTNHTGASQFAEVSYFLRNGNLYRRVLLVRQKYTDFDPTAIEPDGDVAAYSSGGRHFWRDFDYSAFWDGTEVRFHTSDSLANDSTTPATIGGIPLSLGIPHVRFGHTVFRNNGTDVLTVGLPREFLNYTDTVAPGDFWAPTPEATEFFGRFTSQETAAENFGYPGRIASNLNPMDPATPLTFDSSFFVSEYTTGATPTANVERRGDDLLMSNVHSFDIELWDQERSEFVDLGHALPTGHFQSSDNANENYGNRFDTWHPNTSVIGESPHYPGSRATALGDPTETPLRAIQITVRYQDVSTGGMRQITRQFSLIDPGR